MFHNPATLTRLERLGLGGGGEALDCYKIPEVLVMPEYKDFPAFSVFTDHVENAEYRPFKKSSQCKETRSMYETAI